MYIGKDVVILAGDHDIDFVPWIMRVKFNNKFDYDHILLFIYEDQNFQFFLFVVYAFRFWMGAIDHREVLFSLSQAYLQK